MSRHIVKLGRLLASLACLALPAWAVAQGQPASVVSNRNAVESIEASQQGGNIVVKLSLKQAPATPPIAFSVASPPRIAFDLPATDNALGKTSQMFNESDLKSANIVQAGDRTRVVLNLNKMTAFESRVQGKAIILTLSPQKTATVGAPLVSRFAESRAADVPHSVKNVVFRRGKNGEARIVVDLSDGNTGIDIRQQGQSLVVDFLKASLPDTLRKTLDVTDFGTPVTGINTLVQGENVRMIVTPKGLWEHNAYQTDNQFVLEVKQVIENPNKITQGSRGGYQGEKLSLNFQAIPIREVLAVVADFSNFNIVISDTVNGNITLVLKDVPWDQALDIILSQKGLDMRKNGNVIMIAPRDELATKEKLDLESKQQISDLEQTRTESFQLNYQKAAEVKTLLTPAAGGTGGKSTSILSSRGSVTVDLRTNKIFVNDTPTRLEDVRKLIAEIDIPARQVLIEARIVIAGDTFFRSLGAKLGFSGAYSNSSRTTAGTSTSSTATTTNAAGVSTTTGTASTSTGSTILAADGTVRNFAQYALGGSLNATGYATGQLSTVPTQADLSVFSLPASTGGFATNPASFAMSLYSRGLSRFIDLEISALEADNKGKVVSSPRILTANQVEALIEQGTEIPYSTTSNAGTATSFRKANLMLKVKPQITPDGNVQMEVEVNKDSIGALTPSGLGIDTKHIKTNVQVENGGTVVIGGIYEETDTNNVTKVPLLGDIPVFGNLFKSQDKTSTKTELLIFLTPKVVSENLLLR